MLNTQPTRVSPQQAIFPATRDFPRNTRFCIEQSASVKARNRANWQNNRHRRGAPRTAATRTTDTPGEMTYAEGKG